MAAYASKLNAYPDKNIVLVGDLNTTPFSRFYTEILLQSTLLDSRKKYGYQPTWHSDFPFLLQIHLDHLWHSETILIKQRQILEITGSDHKALWVCFKNIQEIR